MSNPTSMVGTYVDSDGGTLTIRHETKTDGTRSVHYRDPTGLGHRVDGPARELWYENGQRERQDWWVDGTWHRLDGPAKELWYKNRQLASQQWWVNDEAHRLDGPAKELWYKNRQLASQEWWVDGMWHHVDGPAVEEWHKNGHLARQEWWVNNVSVADDDRLRAVIDPATPPQRLARLARSVDPGIAALAANSPACPEEAKTLWALTQSGQ